MDRVLRINDLIQEEVSKILLREVDFPPDVLVTVVRVDTDSDLKRSKIYVNLLPTGQKDEVVMDILKHNAGRVQNFLIKRLNMRYVPRISFVMDKSGQEVDLLGELFKKMQTEEGE